MLLICEVVKHTPIFNFQNIENMWSEYNSIYYDDANLSLYHARIGKEANADLVRFRWYNEITEQSPVFIDKKAPSGETLNGKIATPEDRCSLAAKNMVDYIRGGLRGAGTFSEKFPVYNEVQDMIVQKKLIPTIRTHYNRTHFRLSESDESMHLCLDTQISMYREDFVDTTKNWRHTGESRVV